MPQKIQKKEMLIIGSYGRGNIGDDAFLIILYDFFKQNFNITINTSNDAELPLEVKDKVKFIETDFFKNPIQKIKTLLKIDVVVYGGGNLWLKLIGEKFADRNLVKMLLVNLVCKILGKKIYYLGCGAADLKGFSLFLARCSSYLADYIVLRDSDSLQRLRLKKNYSVLPDLTVNLIKKENLVKGLEDKKSIKKVKKVGISVLYFVPNPNKNFDKMLTQIAKLINQNQNIEFTLISMFTSKKEPKNDTWASNELIKKVQKKDTCKVFESSSLQEYLQILSQQDLVIGTRLHSNILSFVAGTPSIGIAYREKVASFFKENKISEKCLKFNNLENLENLFSKTQQEIQDYYLELNKIRQDLFQKHLDYQKIVDKIIQS